MSSQPVTPLASDFSQYARLRAAADRNGSDPKVLRQAAQQFESLFTQMLLKSMRATTLGDDLGGDQAGFYQDMFDQQLATHLSAGKGVGLADMLVRQLSHTAAAGASEAAHTADPRAPRALPGTAAPAAVSAPAQAEDFSPDNSREFIEAVRPHAEKAAAELGVPARVLIAQAALETGWGKHLMRDADGGASYNLFGVKSHGWSGSSTPHDTAEYVNGTVRSEKALFRSYSSLGEAFDDYVNFLKSNPRYAEALKAGNDASRFARGLQKAGYATDPHYAQKLLRVAYGNSMNVAFAGGATTASA
jgi:flagellar protein FlgJ